MLSMSEKREVRRMQKEREKELEKEERRKNQSDSKQKLAATAVVAAGVIYTGYRFKDDIASAAGTVTSKVAEGIAKTTGDQRFQRMVEEQKNVMGAVAETYRQDEGGAYNTFSNLLKNMPPAERNEKIRNRTKALNKNTEEVLRQNNIPKDVRNKVRDLEGTRSTAFGEAQIKNLEKILEKDKYKKVLKERTDDLIEITRDSTKSYNENLFGPGKEEDSNSKQIDSTLLKTLGKFNNNNETNINLDFDSDDDIMNTAQSFQDAINEAKKVTQQQSYEFTEETLKVTTAIDLNKLKDNTYAQEKLFEDTVRFKAVQETVGKPSTYIESSLKQEGWEPLKIKDAQSTIVERNGKLFVDNTAEKGRTVDETFSVSHEGEISFAESFTEMGKRLGVDKETIDETIYSSDLYLRPDTGEILNTSIIKDNLEDMLNFSVDNFQIPVIGINPLNYLQSHFNLGQDDNARSAVYRKGAVSAFTGDTLETEEDIYTRNSKSTGVLSKEYFQINENIYESNAKESLMQDAIDSDSSIYETFSNQLDSNLVAEGYEIMDTSEKIGRRYSDVMSGRIKEGGAEETFLKRILAVDPNQETFINDIKEVGASYENASHGQNQPVAIVRDVELGDMDRAAKEIENLGDKADKARNTLSINSSNKLSGILVESINKNLGTDELEASMLESPQGLMEAAKILDVYNKNEAPRDDKQSQMIKDISNEITKNYNRAKKDPKTFFSKKSYEFPNEIMQGDLAKLEGRDKPIIRTGEDKLKGLIQQFGILAMEGQSIDPRDHLSNNIFSDTENIIKETEELKTKIEASFFSKSLKKARTPYQKDVIVHDWIDFFGEDKNYTNLYNVMGDIEPFGKKSVEASFQSLTSASQMPIKKHRNMLKATNENYKDYLKGKKTKKTLETLGVSGMYEEQDIGTPLTPIFSALGEQMNVITGHQGEVDTASITPWNLANNLNRGIEKFGLGLSPDKRKSAASIVWNISTRRMLAPIVAYNTAKSMDDFFLDGAGRKQLAQGYANIHLGVAGIRDKAGLTSISKTLDEYVPGMEHLRGSPLGMRASKLTFGMVADGRSEEELEKYYHSGTDPIRKGRWWQMGSTTPWIGERIEYYRPNAYRRTMSDYEYTEDMYGSKGEYWRNHWMPNIYNPLAPLKHFVTDPYHYEKKHENSRPYAVTGGFASLQAIPVIGSGVDAVASTFLKPSKEHKKLRASHREFLRSSNEGLVSDYMSSNTPGMLNVSPRGKVGITTTAPVVNITDTESGFVDEQILMEDDMRHSSEKERLGMGQGVASGTRPQADSKIQTMKDVSRRVLERFNIIKRSNTAPSGYNPAMAGIPTSGRTQSPSTVHNQIDPYQVNDLDNDVVNATGFKDPAGLAMYSADQVRAGSGFFGYLSMNATGLVQRDDRLRLEDSSRFRDFNETFWDSGLGGYDGLDGSLSEIGRRFTGAQQKRRYYNPIKNEMPDWLPGDDYFVNFKRGDPFNKLPYGEIRLPGEAYETVHNVQKDEFGNYSAFDRYKILADIAPYSDEYRFAKSEVALLNQNGLLSEERQDEYRDIREQVTNKNKKYQFEPRKFKNAEVNKQTVTVDKVIDQNTFIAKEYPNNPIKLAGVSIKADDAENVALMASIIKPGKKVEIGLDADPMNRVRDDMLDTMRAVVYAPKYAEFKNESSLKSGQNVNHFLSRQTEEDGGSIGIRDDKSGVATAALHSEGQLTIGKNVESFVHTVLPNIPILNIVADKFYPIRSATEEYEGKLYGKDFRSWHRPIKHWVVPMLETGTNKNPAIAAARGAAIASFMSRNSKNQALFAELGASTYGTIAGIRSIKEFVDRKTGNDEKWIPERRQEQREFDEYFDKIEYIKYKGLYEKAKEMALKKEGVDVDAYLGAVEEDGESNDKYKNYLENRKKQLTITQKSTRSETVSDFSKNQIREINEKLKEIDNDRPNQPVGSYTALAFRYKEEYESTLYGAKDTHDYMKIHRALPKADKEFFTAFQKASPKERQRILQLVPKNQRNIYRQQWGLTEKEEDNVDLDEYFDEYELPDEDWEGWRPDTSLENIKVKVMQNEGMELTEANYWDEHEDRAALDPSEAIEINKLSDTSLSKSINRGRLKKALEGAGLKNVTVGMRTSAADVSRFNTNLNIQNNREEEVKKGIRTYLNK